MTFAFNTPVKGVGGFINHMPGYSTMPTTIAVYDSDMNLIESETLTFITDGSTNSGEFHGFLEPSPTISYFTLSNNYIGITQFTIPAQAQCIYDADEIRFSIHTASDRRPGNLHVCP